MLLMVVLSQLRIIVVKKKSPSRAVRFRDLLYVAFRTVIFLICLFVSFYSLSRV